VKDETELRLKRAYWQGVFDALNPADKAKSEKSQSEKTQRERLTAGVWLTALDWMLSQDDEVSSTLEKTEDTKGWET
jgi:hypothetical protein